MDEQQFRFDLKQYDEGDFCLDSCHSCAFLIIDTPPLPHWLKAAENMQEIFNAGFSVAIWVTDCAILMHYFRAHVSAVHIYYVHINI